MQITNSVAFVTGANRGIGAALVAKLLKNKASKVYAGYRTDPGSISDFNRKTVEPVQLDVGDARSVAAAAKQADDTTLLINNAGVLASGNLLKSDLAAIQQDFQTNFYGPLHLVRAFAESLADKDEAAIVNMITILAFASMPPMGGYSASKAATHSLTQALRGELRGRGISVHGVYPGPVDTDMIRGFEMQKTSPLDVAAAILRGVEAGEEDIMPDPMSAQAYAGYKQEPKELERQFASFG